MLTVSGQADNAPASRLTCAPCLASLCIIGVLLWFDHYPRFYQGDSIAYLATGLRGWIPPDRSWAYGYISRWLLQLSRHAGTLVAVQAFSLWAALLVALHSMARSRVPPSMLMLTASVLSLDPLIEAYVRFWLSDLVAMALFLGFVFILQERLIRRDDRTVRTWAALGVISTACVFVRIAYAPAELLTIGMLYATSLWHRGQRLRARFLAVLLVPGVSVGLLVGANAAIFGRPFVNKMSSLYQLGVFLPGIELQDFQAAGIAMTEPEFTRFHLEDYDLREAHVWADGPQFMRSFIQSGEGEADIYSERIQGRFRQVFRHALMNHPQTLALVYLVSLERYFDPRLWVSHFANEMGFDRALPDWAVGFVNATAHAGLTPRSSEWQSLATRCLNATIGLYPYLLGLGCVVAVLTLARRDAFPVDCVPACALLAVTVVTPLYSHGTKPRYVLAAVFLTYFFIILTAARLTRGMRSAAEFPAVASIRSQESVDTKCPGFPP